MSDKYLEYKAAVLSKAAEHINSAQTKEERNTRKLALQGMLYGAGPNKLSSILSPKAIIVGYNHDNQKP